MTQGKRRVSDVAVALAFLILVGLGTWQVQRLHWKQALIEARQAQLTAPPIASWDAAAEFRRVRLQGSFLSDRAIPVGLQGRVVVPLALDDGSYVLVETAERPPGRVTVEGYLRESEVGGSFTPANDPAKGQWFTADIPAIAKSLGLAPMRPFRVVTAPPPELPNDHLQYAVTWYSLAVALIVIYLLARRRQTAP